MARHIVKVEPYYVPGATVQALLQQVARIGIAPAAILEQAKLPVRPMLREGAAMGMTRRQFSPFYRACILALEAHAADRNGQLTLEVEETHMAFQCVINCQTLGAAMERTAAFFRMLNRGIECALVRRPGESAEFQITNGRKRRCSASFLSDLAGLSAFHQFYGWLIGDAIAVHAVEMSYPENFRQDIVMDYFGIPIGFGGRTNGFAFAADLLDRPVLRSHWELVKLLELFPFDFVPRDEIARPLSLQVQRILQDAMLGRARIPDIPELAEVFGLSCTTFRRRLTEEGTSVGTLKEACRRQLAADLLKQRDITFKEIAERLGYSDSGVFHRAFRAWTGQSPSGFRRAELGSDSI